jgi:hypothetical protein
VLRLQVAWDFGQDAVMELIRRALEGANEGTNEGNNQLDKNS